VLKKIIKKMVGSCVVASAALPLSFVYAMELPDVVKLVVPASPGASTDLLARAIGEELSLRTGKTFVVENKPGASTMIGSANVAKSPADGSVLLINSTSLVSSGATMANPPVDIRNDLVPLSLLVKTPLVVAASVQSGIETPADLIREARSRELTHGTVGVGSIAHFAQEMLSDSSGASFSHVPYKGTSAAVTDMSGGIIDTVIGTWSSIAPSVQAGRARAVAITSTTVNPAFPTLPTLTAEAPGFEIDLWVGMFGPSGMSPELVDYLNKELNAVAASPKLRAFYAPDGGEPIQLSSAEISQKINAEYDKFKNFAVTKQILIN